MKSIFTAALIFCAVTVFAHPHVWIDSVLQFKNNRITAEWTFDEMFSQVILSDFDIDRDKQLAGMEITELKKGMFDNLVNFDYFMKVYCGNDLMEIEKVEGFNAFVKGSKVIYSFTVKLSGKGCGKTLELYNYDDTLYSDIDVKSVNGSADLQMAADGIKYAVFK